MYTIHEHVAFVYMQVHVASYSFHLISLLHVQQITVLYVRKVLNSLIYLALQEF